MKNEIDNAIKYRNKENYNCNKSHIEKLRKSYRKFNK